MMLFWPAGLMYLSVPLRETYILLATALSWRDSSLISRRENSHAAHRQCAPPVTSYAVVRLPCSVSCIPDRAAF